MSQGLAAAPLNGRAPIRSKPELSASTQRLTIAHIEADTLYGYLLLISESHNGYPDEGRLKRRLAVARTLANPYHWAVYVRDIPLDIEIDTQPFADFIWTVFARGLKQSESAAIVMFPDLAAAFGRAGITYWGP